MYTSAQQFRREIDDVVIGYVWEADPQQAPPRIIAANPKLKMLALQRRFAPWTKSQAESYQKEIIAEYCWVAYSKSKSAVGDMVIGRQGDLSRQGLYEKVAELVRMEIGPLTRQETLARDNKFGRIAPNLTLLDEETHGNLLNQDKWAGPVNDAWILGGIHRQAKFRLASPRIMDNLWNQNGYLIVTAREIIGLICFGYELQQIGPWQVFVLPPEKTSTAAGATLIKYSQSLQTHSTIQMAEHLRDLEPEKGTRLRSKFH